MPTTGSLSVLRNTSFRVFALARLVSASGSAMAPIALAFSVLGFDGRASSLAIVLASNTAPQLIFALLGGLFADRFSRRRLIVLGNLALAAIQAGVALLVASGAATTVRIAVLAAAAGGATAMVQPAMNSVLPQIVGAEQVQEANALLRLPQNVIRLVAPVAAGALVAFVGAQWALGWDSASFALAAALCSRLQISGNPKPGTSVLREFREGWQEFASRLWIWSYVLSGTVVVALWLGGYQLLGPVVMADRNLGAAAWGVVQAAFAGGLVAGGVISLKWKPRRIMVACVCANLPLALPLFVLAARAPLPILAGAAALAGIGLDIAIVCWNTAVQQHLPDAVMGRVNSFTHVGELAAVPLGYLVVGVAGTVLGTSHVLVLGAAVMTVATLALLFVPSVWNVRRRGAVAC